MGPALVRLGDIHRAAGSICVPRGIRKAVYGALQRRGGLAQESIHPSNQLQRAEEQHSHEGWEGNRRGRRGGFCQSARQRAAATTTRIQQPDWRSALRSRSIRWIVNFLG